MDNASPPITDQDPGRRVWPPGPPRRAFVTGGAGFVGSHLAEALHSRGDHVVVVDNLSTGSPENLASLIGQERFEYIVADIRDAELIDRLVARSDIVFHLAASVGVQLIMDRPVEVIENNVLGTHVVLSAAADHGRKVLLTSTSEIYGKNTKIPFSEDDDRTMGPTTRARWSYAESKAIDEFLALAYHSDKGLPVVIARLFNTVGVRQTGQYGMVVPRFVDQALAGKPLTVYDDGLQSRCFCDVEDVVRALMALVDSPAADGKIVNVGSPNEITILGLATAVLACLGTTDDIERRIQFVPYSEAYDSGFEDMRRRVPDITRIGQLIGWTPRIPLEETLRRVIASRQQGVLVQ